MDGFYKALNDNPLLLYALVTLAIIFHKQIGVAIETALPWLIRRHTQDLQTETIHEAEAFGHEDIKTVDNPSFAKDQQILTIVFDPYCMTCDSKFNRDWILSKVTQAKQTEMKLTFNLINVERVGRRFLSAWKDAVETIIRENGIFVQIVFPQNPQNGLDELYDHLTKLIKDTNAHGVIVRMEGRL